MPILIGVVFKANNVIAELESCVPTPFLAARNLSITG